MLSAVAWVPRGAAKPTPAVAEPDDEELALMQQMAAAGVADEDEDEDEEDEDEEGEDEGEGMDEEKGEDDREDAREKARTAALAVTKKKGKKGKTRKGKGRADEAMADVADELAELDMDNYDEEDDSTVNLFGTGRGVGGAYYRSNEEDPYLAQEADDEDEDEIDDITIRPTDLLVLGARTEDDVSFIELWVCEEPPEKNDPEQALNIYVHHDIMLPAFPLALAWMDFNPTSAAAAMATTSSSSMLVTSAAGGSTAADVNPCQGSFVAVATMNPEIEIWDLDVLDAVEPAAVLGGSPSSSSRQREGRGDKSGEKSKKKTKKGKKKKKKKGEREDEDNEEEEEEALREGSHEGAVMALAWNRTFRNVLASGGADGCVKVWDMATQACVHTLQHHAGKVQAVSWCPTQPTVLLSGSFDQTVALIDGRTPTGPVATWSLSSDVEAILWDPHCEARFVVSSEDGLVHCHDVRTVLTSSSTSSAAAAGSSKKGGLAGKSSVGSSSSSGRRGSGSGAQPLFTLHAHDRATCTMAFSPHQSGLLATGSTDKKVKLWDLSSFPAYANAGTGGSAAAVAAAAAGAGASSVSGRGAAVSPSPVASCNPGAGAVFSVAFCGDVPGLLAIGGSKGSLSIWNIFSDQSVVARYGLQF